jgi:hypothetical protein
MRAAGLFGCAHGCGWNVVEKMLIEVREKRYDLV